MKYRMYTGDQPILKVLQDAGIVNPEHMKDLKVQELDAESDEEVVAEVEDFMEHTGIPIRVLTRIGTNGEEIIVRRFGN